MALVIRTNGERRGLVPFYGPTDTMREIEQLARRFWEPWQSVELTTGLKPQTDVYEEDGRLVLKAELPGMKREDIEIKLEGDALSIRAEKKEEEKKDATHHTRERYFGEYFRTVTLPYAVDEDKIDARYEDGVLEVVLPRAKEVQTRKIEVKGRAANGPATPGAPKTA